MDNRSLGQIITFYSYKGGTGRSMTLANVACILAERKDNTPGKGVLMMDWDLEAPGLHRYFCNKLEPRKRAADSRGTGSCDAEPGLIDLFYELNDKLDSFNDQGEGSGHEMFSEEIARKIFNDIDLDRYIIPTKINALSLLKAGRFNRNDTNEYPERVNKFSWESLYNKSPQLMRVFAEVLSERYDYVLIDSRTGITDISGVCTMLLPEKLVVVFTPNMQSLMGAVEVVSRATEYRKESDDLRSLIVFPLVSRVESNEPDLRHDWRFGNPERGVTGYQDEFEKVLAEAYSKDKVNLNTYFDEMQIQHVPKYAYGEEIAVLEERTEDKFSLRRGYRAFANKLTDDGLPWEGLQMEAPFSPQSDAGGISTKTATLIRSALTANTSVLGALLFLIAGVLLAALVIIGAIYFLRPSTTPVADFAEPSPDAPPVSISLPSLVGRIGYLATDSNIRSKPDVGGPILGVHYRGALIEVLEESTSTTPVGGSIGPWFWVRVMKNGCKTSGSCGNNLDGMPGMAAMEGWVFSGLIAFGISDQLSDDQMANPAETVDVNVTVTVASPGDGFLALKSEPCLSPCGGKMLAKIPHGTRINLKTCQNFFEIADLRRGRWCSTTYEGISGWVFNAFVKY